MQFMFQSLIELPTMSKRIFISADHGMAIIYFLQSDVVPTLLNAGVYWKANLGNGIRQTDFVGCV